MRDYLLALHAVAVTSSAAAGSGAAGASPASTEVSHKVTVMDCARSLEITVCGAMKELQVLAATSTPILQRFARFFTDILHESCRAIIINTAVGALPPFRAKIPGTPGPIPLQVSSPTPSYLHWQLTPAYRS
jgi:hypothetical protein